MLYRINTVEIQLPPLRKRIDDIPLLVEHFTTMYCRKYKKEPKSVSGEALNRLKNYSWPGNIRELQHMLERVIIMSEATSLQPSDFFFTSNDVSKDMMALSNYHLNEAEKMLIIKAVGKHDGNLTKAAKELGITRTALYRRLEKYGL